MRSGEAPHARAQATRHTSRSSSGSGRSAGEASRSQARAKYEAAAASLVVKVPSGSACASRRGPLCAMPLMPQPSVKLHALGSTRSSRPSPSASSTARIRQLKRSAGAYGTTAPSRAV